MLAPRDATSRASGRMTFAVMKMRRKIVAVSLVVAALTMVAEPAWAHGGQSPTEGYVMVQEAISYLVNQPGPNGTAEALVHVNDALAAKDQDGVNLATLVKAKADLTAGAAAAARPLLQDSISVATAALKPATGDETGTSAVVPPLQETVALSGANWILLVVSMFVALGGAVLAYSLRPKENLGALRRDIRTARTAAAEAARVLTSKRENNVR